MEVVTCNPIFFSGFFTLYLGWQEAGLRKVTNHARVRIGLQKAIRREEDDHSLLLEAILLSRIRFFFSSFHMPVSVKQIEIE